MEQAILDDKSIAHVAGTCIGSYLIRKKKLLINSTYAPIRRNGIKKLHEICTEAEIEQDSNEIVRIGNVYSIWQI